MNRSFVSSHASLNHHRSWLYGITGIPVNVLYFAKIEEQYKKIFYTKRDGQADSQFTPKSRPDDQAWKTKLKKMKADDL